MRSSRSLSVMDMPVGLMMSFSPATDALLFFMMLL